MKPISLPLTARDHSRPEINYGLPMASAITSSGDSGFAGATVTSADSSASRIAVVGSGGHALLRYLRRGNDAYILVARENERVCGRRDLDVIVAWAIVVTHHRQVLDDFNCLGVVKAPRHTTRSAPSSTSAAPACMTN
jgi:hypothetical protein